MSKSANLSGHLHGNFHCRCWYLHLGPDFLGGPYWALTATARVTVSMRIVFDETILVLVVLCVITMLKVIQFLLSRRKNTLN